MSLQPNELVDLLEIFHARSLRDRLRQDVRRLECDDDLLPGTDPEHRAEIRELYATMLAMSESLLLSVGDAD